MNAVARVSAFCDAWESTEYLSSMPEVAGAFDNAPALTIGDLRALLAAAAKARVWYYTDDDEGSSSEVYLDADAAKTACSTHYVAENDPSDAAVGDFTWREFTPRSQTRSVWLLDHDGTFTGWSVDSIRVADAHETGSQS